MSSRPARFMQKSKSHDDASDVYAPVGTARGRIARQGARLVQSRSPSSSPTRSAQHASGEPVRMQAYVSKCESVESLNDEENSSLLTKEEKKSMSNSSILVFFDGSDLQDTRV